jgi:superfamily II DNA/RNA helicase
MLLDVRYAVIDEADRMLDMGFIPDVNRLMALLPKKRQTLLFSATLANEIVDLAAHYLLTPKRITVAQDLTTAATVTQYKISLPDAEKRQAVCHLVETFSKDAHAIVFCNRKRDVDVLVRSLCRHGFKAAGLHGDMAQTARNQTLESFRNGELDILVASDVAARGLDVKNLSLVVNFNVPNHGEDYVHRVGRTGRAGATGHAFTLVTSAEEKKWSFIEKHLGTQVKVYALPTTTPEKQSAENRAPEKQTVEKQSVEKNGSEKREKRVYPTSTRKKFEESDTPVLGFGAAIPAFMSNGTEGSRTTVNNQ